MVFPKILTKREVIEWFDYTPPIKFICIQHNENHIEIKKVA